MNDWCRAPSLSQGSCCKSHPDPGLFCLAFASQALGAVIFWHSELHNITRSAALHTVGFFSARDFNVILVLLKALNPVNKPHLMHWVSVVQQDFFIRNSRRNARLEGQSCPKNIEHLCNSSSSMSVGITYFQAKHYLLSKKVRRGKKTDFKFQFI